MGRLGSCLVASVVLHGVVWVWLAARFSIWKHEVAQPSPAGLITSPPANPQDPIEVEPVSDVPSGGGLAVRGPASTGTSSGPKQARAAKVQIRPAPGIGTSTEALAADPAPVGAVAAGGSDVASGSGAGSGPGVGSGPGPGSGSGPGPGSGPGSGPGAAGGPGGAGDVAALISARIQAHRRYPLLARKRGLEGTVEVVFRVDAAGNVTDLRVDKSAGELFDAAAVEAVRAAAPLPACTQPVRVPIRFRLTGERAIR
jgi:TonB family protein